MFNTINLRNVFAGVVFGVVALSGGVVFAEPLEIGTIERPPFATKTSSGEWTGFSVDVWKEIAERNDFEYSFAEFQVFSEMVNSVEVRDLDMAAANISITSTREEVMDYSQPIYDSGLQVMISTEGNNVPFWKIIWDSGIIAFLGFAVLVLLVIAHFLWFFERGKESHRHDYFRDDYVGGIWDAFWWAFIIMTMGGFENEVPSSKISRFLAMFWIVVSLFFISTLTAKITTSLTLSELQSDIASYQDLSGKEVGISKGSPSKEFLDDEGISTIEYATFGELITDLKNGVLDAVVHDTPVLGYFASHEGKGKYTLVGETFKPEKYGFLLPEESTLKESIDRTLIQMKEDGSYNKIEEKYFGN